MRGTAGWLGVAALAAALGGCGGTDATNPCSKPPVPIGVAPALLRLATGGQGRVTATGAVQNASCQLIASAVRWDVADTTVATVRADTGRTAIVTGRAAGNTFVIATFLADTTARAAGLVQVGTGGGPQ